MGAAKTGLDDFVAARRTVAAQGIVAELEALARPWKGAPPPPLAPDPDDPAEEIARLRRENGELKRSIGTLVQVGMNPHLKEKEKVAIFATFGLVQQKRDRGEAEPDGTVRLSAAEIADDWRPKPEKGAHVAPFNPKGSVPRMARDKVRPLLERLSEEGILPASPRPMVRHRDGSSFQDTDWAFVPPASLDAFLAPAAQWRPEEITPRKPRTLSCPHCNEVHKVIRRDYCEGCGTLRQEQVIDPPDKAAVEPVTDSDAHLRKIFGGEETALESVPPAPAPVSLSPKNYRRCPPEEPSHLAYLFDPAPPDRYTDVAHGRRAP